MDPAKKTNLRLPQHHQNQFPEYPGISELCQIKEYLNKQCSKQVKGNGYRIY